MSESIAPVRRRRGRRLLIALVMMGVSTLGGAGLVVGTAAPASALPHCGLLHNIHNAVFGYSACHRGTIKYCWRTVYNADSGTYKEFRFACGVE